MKIEEEYNPALCDHKHENGLSSWSFQSEESCNFPGSGRRVAVYVCYKCGEIRIAGRNDGNSFDEHFNIHHPEALGAIIKQANWINEKIIFIDAREPGHQLEQIKKLRKGLDEEQGDWIEIENNNFPVDVPIIIEHGQGYDALRFYQGIWRYWYSDERVKDFIISNILRTARRYLIASNTLP